MASHNNAEPAIMLLQLCKLKKYFGTMGVSNTFYGTKMLLNADVPDINDYKKKMEDTDRELTQGVSQLTGPAIVSLSDDLLNTPRMTIHDLIESSETCSGTVLVRTCDIETALGWYYQSCIHCKSKVTVYNGSLHCDKCGVTRTSIPRYKVNLQVIDNSGSTTFTLFDRTVTQVLGRSVQNLLADMNQDLVYPPELDTFVDKRMLFKVEVNDANLFRNIRYYTVKRMSDDVEIINQFISLHSLNGVDDNGEAECVDLCSDAADNTNVAEGVGSTKDDMNTNDSLDTPTSKSVGKRTIDSVECGADNDAEGGSSSANKIQKLATVKIEKMD